MPYSTLTDIKEMIPEEIILQLTDDEDLGSINQSRIDRAISAADAEIDSYCGDKYSVPFSTVPDVVKAMSIDIAIYSLYSRKTEEMPETREQRYKDAIRKLTRIADGKLSIGEDPAPAAPSQGGPETNKTNDDRIFTRDSLKNF